MQEPTSDNAELSGLAAQLATLAPRASLDRDRLMFAAGQRWGVRRLRIAHRWLAASGVACGGLLAVVVTSQGRTNVPLAIRPPAAVQAPNPASDTARDKGTSSLADGALAMHDGPTNLRLLQLLGRDANADLAIPADRASSAPMNIDEPLPQSTGHALLKEYLRDSQNRL
jgi:hypothetical protein